MLGAAFIAFPLFLLSEEPGAPAGSTGGSFPGELSCAQSDCHDDGNPNSGGGSVSMSVNGAPIDQFSYQPGQTVPVTVRVNDPGAQRWGFQLTARSADGCNQAGAFTRADASVIVFDDSSISPCASGPLEWATHIFPKAGAANNTYDVNWTAPADGFGAVRFAAAGNGANGDLNNTGDNIYTVEATVQPGAPPALPQPAISAGGIVLANLLPSIAAGSPRGLLTAFGADFAAPGTFETAQLNEQGRISENLGGTCVETSGRRSPLLGITQTQVSFQASHLTGLGPAEIVVINNCDTSVEMRSAPMNVNIQREAPGFLVFLVTGFIDAGGANPITAVHNNDGACVGPVELPCLATLPPTRVARRGDFIQLFGTGFGQTETPIEAGAVPGAAFPLAGDSQIEVTIGGIPVPPEDLFYVGAAPCCASLDQITMRIPAAVPDGDQQVIITINGVSSPAGPFIRVEGIV